MMARSSNTYPTWEKLPLDPEAPPSNYWYKGSRECGICLVRWGNYDWLGHKCPDLVCRGKLVVKTDEAPTVTWRMTVKMGLVAAFEDYYAEWNEGLDDEGLSMLEAREVEIKDDDRDALMQELEGILQKDGAPKRRRRTPKQ